MNSLSQNLMIMKMFRATASSMVASKLWKRTELVVGMRQTSQDMLQAAGVMEKAAMELRGEALSTPITKRHPQE